LRRLADLYIAPRVIAYDKNGLLLTWLSGNTPDNRQFKQFAEQGALAKLLGTLHQHPPTGFPLQLKKQLRAYYQAIDKKRNYPRWQHLQRHFLHQPLPVPLKVSPLHMDIHALNLIMHPDQTTLSLIDWEYAADGDIALEIAALFSMNGWDSTTCDRFLSDYSQYAYTDAQQLAFQVRRWLPWVKYLALMWYEVRWQQTQDKKFLDFADPLHAFFSR
jgi:thiamine kinase